MFDFHRVMYWRTKVEGTPGDERSRSEALCYSFSIYTSLFITFSFEIYGYLYGN